MSKLCLNAIAIIHSGVKHSMHINYHITRQRHRHTPHPVKPIRKLISPVMASTSAPLYSVEIYEKNASLYIAYRRMFAVLSAIFTCKLRWQWGRCSSRQTRWLYGGSFLGEYVGTLPGPDKVCFFSNRCACACTTRGTRHRSRCYVAVNVICLHKSMRMPPGMTTITRWWHVEMHSYNCTMLIVYQSTSIYFIAFAVDKPFQIESQPAHGTECHCWHVGRFDSETHHMISAWSTLYLNGIIQLDAPAVIMLPDIFEWLCNGCVLGLMKYACLKRQPSGYIPSCANANT